MTAGVWNKVDWSKLAPLFLAVLGIIVYLNSFRGAFVFDDTFEIVENQSFKSFRTCVRTMRPLVNLTFCANYKIGGVKAADYHAVNLAIHVMAGFFLFGIVRRTLRLPDLAVKYGRVASPLAWSVAAIWLVHPLQTESVTYLSQRAEAMMGLFYLLAIYCFLKGATSPDVRGWYAGAVIACALGMLSKPVMVTAPVMILLYDICFISKSLKAALITRWRFYLCAAATWLILPLLLSFPVNSAGFGGVTVSPVTYAMTQPEIIIRYLKLAFWPCGLCFDYDWQAVESWKRVIIPAMMIVGLVSAILWEASRFPQLSFCGIWFFVVLMPTSSILPITDLAAEHRMYLPLASLSALAVVGFYSLVQCSGCRFPGWNRHARWMTVLPLVGVIAILSALTIQRNAVYRSGETLWRDVIAKRPANHRAYACLAGSLLDQQNYVEAMNVCRNLLAMLPGFKLMTPSDIPAKVTNSADKTLYMEARYYAYAHNYFGVACARQGLLSEAIGHFREAARILPFFDTAQGNLAQALAESGQGQGKETGKQ